MNCREAREKLFLLAEKGNDIKDFSETLNPGEKNILGIRFPELRKLAAIISKEDSGEYLDSWEYECYEDCILYNFVLGRSEYDIDVLLGYFKSIMPYVTSWSICDSLCQSFKAAKKYQKKVWDFIEDFIYSENEFYERTAAVMYLSHYINDEYIDMVLENLVKLKNEGYYLKMGKAWAAAEAYIKYPRKAEKYIFGGRFERDVTKMALRKLLDSYRITKEEKEKIRCFRV